MPVLTIGIVPDCFYLLIFYSEKFSTWVWRLPFAVNGNLNLSKKKISVLQTAYRRASKAGEKSLAKFVERMENRTEISIQHLL